jgi:hypothetical protein
VPKKCCIDERSIFLTPKVLKKTDNCRLELSGMRLTNAKTVELNRPVNLFIVIREASQGAIMSKSAIASCQACSSDW